MKTSALRVTMLALLVAVMSLIGSTTASAQYARVQVGRPPPPPPMPAHVYQPWAPPYRGAVWIAGYQQWRGGRWVWVGGYYSYPPRRGGVWVQPYYRGGYYYPGRWRY